MPTVVIIHAAEDTLPARALAEKLRQAKLNVVLEKGAGEDLRAAAKAAQICIALWSPRSIAQQPLVDDAGSVGRGKVVHVAMQSAQIPEAFRRDVSVNLTGWRGEDDFPGWRELAKIVTDKAGVPPLPPPAPRPPSGFFQPGIPNAAATNATPAPRGKPTAAQPQTALPRRAAQTAARPSTPERRPESAQPTKSGGNGLVIGVAALAVVAVLGGGGFYLWSQSQGAQTTSAAWEDVERNDAAALRAFIDGAPGAYRQEALEALAELEERTFEAASDADSIEALEAFLSEFPDSEHAIAARGRIAELQSLPQPPAETAPPSDVEEPALTDPDLLPPAAESGAVPEPSQEPGPATLTPPAPDTAPPAN